MYVWFIPNVDQPMLSMDLENHNLDCMWCRWLNFLKIKQLNCFVEMYLLIFETHSLIASWTSIRPKR